MDESSATRRSLIVRLKDPGDQAAWHEFVALYEPLIYRLARRKGPARCRCKRLVPGGVSGGQPRNRRLGSGPARGSFRGWLSRIARNLLINFLTRGTQSASRQRSDQRSGPARSPARARPVGRRRSSRTSIEKQLFQWAADEVRGEFAPATWLAFWQTAIEGRAPKEVAAELEISVGAVYIARSRVLAALKKRIESRCDENIEFIEVDHASPDKSL